MKGAFIAGFVRLHECKSLDTLLIAAYHNNTQNPISLAESTKNDKFEESEMVKVEDKRRRSYLQHLIEESHVLKK